MAGHLSQFYEQTLQISLTKLIFFGSFAKPRLERALDKSAAIKISLNDLTFINEFDEDAYLNKIANRNSEVSDLATLQLACCVKTAKQNNLFDFSRRKKCRIFEDGSLERRRRRSTTGSSRTGTPRPSTSRA